MFKKESCMDWHRKIGCFIFIFIFSGFYGYAQTSAELDRLARRVQQNPKDVNLRVEYAEALIAADKQLEAIGEYIIVLESEPENMRYLRRLIELYKWNDMPDKAIRGYEKIAKLDPGDLENLKLLAQNYVWADQQGKAILLYEKILKREPDNIELREKLAQLYSWNENPKKAVEHYEILLKANPENISILSKLADNYFWLGRNQEGIKTLEKLVALAPDSTRFKQMLAEQYSWNKKPQAAIEHYENLLVKQPNNKDVKKHLADLYLDNNQPQKATRLYTILSREDRQNKDYMIGLARAFMLSKLPEQALKIIHYVLRLFPQDKEALFLLAEYQRWNGEWDLARQNLNQILKDDPGNKPALELLTGIQQEYNPLAEIRYYRIHDSNGLLHEHVPLSFFYYQNRHWEWSASTHYYWIQDENVDSTNSGFGLKLSAKYHFNKKNSVYAELAGTNYTSKWTPVSLILQYNRSFWDKVYANVRYFRNESREGIFALQEQIMIDGFAGEFYAQVLPRWSLSGTYNFGFYSDDNQKITSSAGTEFSLLRKNPNLGIYSYFYNEDFRYIYPTSKPYWTPEKLYTTVVGARISQEFFSFMGLGVTYGYTTQENVHSNNFSGYLSITIPNFTKFYIQYTKDGSDIYNAESVSGFIQYRF